MKLVGSNHTSPKQGSNGSGGFAWLGIVMDRHMESEGPKNGDTEKLRCYFKQYANKLQISIQIMDSLKLG